MQNHSVAPHMMLQSFWRNRNLISQMTRREVVGRYNGSILGLTWSFLHPLLMLSVYTFVFSIVFKARWHGDGDNSKIGFAIALFTGMITHRFFAECIERSPEIIVANVNFVKKVVFPLEIFAPVTLIAAAFHSAISLLVLCIAIAIFSNIHLTALIAPIIFLPLGAFTLGVSWFLSALGVFIRDTGQIVGILTTIMMFLSPMFYPISALPKSIQPLIMLNPLSFIMEQARLVLIDGATPDWYGLCIYSIISILVACLGFTWFQKTRKGFADVL